MKRESEFVILKKLERAFGATCDERVDTLDGKRKYFKNDSERAFAVATQHAGWNVLKQEWPDFLCVRNGELICVEVKKYTSHKLADAQWTMARLLSEHGIKCYRWSPKGGFLRLFRTEAARQGNR